MTAFTGLELAVLHSIFLETPELVPGLKRQLAMAMVIKRENSGGGFFTKIKVGDDAPALSMPSVLGHTTHASIEGLDHGFGFVLFIENGRLDMLEGYAFSPENTLNLDLTALHFKIYNEPVQWLG